MSPSVGLDPFVCRQCTRKVDCACVHALAQAVQSARQACWRLVPSPLRSALYPHSLLLGDAAKRGSLATLTAWSFKAGSPGALLDDCSGSSSNSGGSVCGSRGGGSSMTISSSSSCADVRQLQGTGEAGAPEGRCSSSSSAGEATADGVGSCHRVCEGSVQAGPEEVALEGGLARGVREAGAGKCSAHAGGLSWRRGALEDGVGWGSGNSGSGSSSSCGGDGRLEGREGCCSSGAGGGGGGRGEESWGLCAGGALGNGLKATSHGPGVCRERAQVRLGQARLCLCAPATASAAQLCSAPASRGGPNW